jgi:hypothetical protein
MVLLGGVDQVKIILVYLESVNLVSRQVHGVHRMYHGHGNHFGHTRLNSKMTSVKWKLASFRLEIVLMSAQDRCTVCTECTRGMEIILGTPDGTPR